MKNIVMETRYEVEGCWAPCTPKCRCCGADEVPVPEKGHFNSKYHPLKRDDGMFLYCCPIGCSVDVADEKMKTFLLVSAFCTKESESWKWAPDFSKFDDCWIDLNGIIYPVASQGHIEFASAIGMGECSLEIDGWVKVSGKFILNASKINQKQRDALFDFAMAKGYATKPLFDDHVPLEFTYRRSTNEH